MKKQFVLYISLSLFIIKTSGQSNLPPAYDIINDTAIHTEIPAGNWKMLKDKGGKLTLQQVIQSPVADEFRFNQSKDNQFDYRIHTYWFCYRLKNAMNHDVEIGFGVDNIEFNESDFATYYLHQNGKWSRYENGIYAPRRKINGLTLNNYIRVVIKPEGELIVYKRVYNSYVYPFSASTYSIGFSKPKEVLEQNYVQDETLYIDAVHDSILFGILLFACVFNFFFYLIVKERVYVWFALYVFILGIGRMFGEIYFVFLRGFPFVLEWIYTIVYSSTLFPLVYFIRSLLNTPILVPRWDRFLNRFNYAALILAFLSSLAPVLFPFINGQDFYKTINSISHDLHIALMACILVTFGIILRRRDSSDKILMRLILPAFFIWCFGLSMEILHTWLGYVPFSANFMTWMDTWWHYIESACLCWVVLSFSWILLQRFRKLQNRISEQAIEKEKEKTALIEQKKIELETTVEERTAELKHSLETLQSTQRQLIQSEKMASLGELTAGIAHEIQNPLNFVNNFSEVNTELIDEASQAVQAGNTISAMELLSSLKDNEQKINSHGKRADSIVKGMLQHSRTSSAQKELTDINVLAEDYLRLSYHGIRAKDKSFHAVIQTDFDPAVGKINIVPQDMSRVMLNLYNNAFYAVGEKMKEQITGYTPTISVNTERNSDHIHIVISDNGTGIPQKIIDKIFQPFFTTKPAGQGTGLGLSMSYDIIKAHGGELKVESREGEFTRFIIQIPGV
ncbi:MAG TPA: ATP-binding protein [Puia sp.]|nr:ATP-binding protein [Puia sp.]